MIIKLILSNSNQISKTAKSTISSYYIIYFSFKPHIFAAVWVLLLSSCMQFAQDPVGNESEKRKSKEFSVEGEKKIFIRNWYLPARDMC